MVSIAQVQHGAAKYIDEEFCRKITGWQKWVIGAGAALCIDRLPEIVNSIKDNKIVSSLGLIDSAGGIDLDTVYRYVKAEADKGFITFNAPMIGAVTLSSADVDKLYQYIWEAQG